ncbi:unnamed protein product [Angiostrongylus costaricensis]|uniref:BBS1 domain-containing protein n=1 Tax=Angiostrongylus costaricensis TaxID=334426 RepID=A0A0R3P9K7_ANGCS|nr:unnamed protein product [Angiostrongylus costaricensis]
MTTSDDVVKWVSALSDDQAGVFTFSNCVCLSDMYGDGDTKLVVAHIGGSKFNLRLKVIRGVTVVGECALAEMPTAVVSFYNEKVIRPDIFPSLFNSFEFSMSFREKVSSVFRLLYQRSVSHLVHLFESTKI